MPTNSKKVLITPAVFLAFVDRNHPKHAQAAAFFNHFAQEKLQVFTTFLAILKTYNQLRQHVSYPVAKEFIRSIYLGNIQILRPNEAEEKAALKLILDEQNTNFSFEQAIINVLADRNTIPQICSFEYNKFFFGIELFRIT